MDGEAIKEGMYCIIIVIDINKYVIYLGKRLIGCSNRKLYCTKKNKEASRVSKLYFLELSSKLSTLKSPHKII